MELKVEGSQLEQIINAAVFQALGETGKEALMQEVVRYLTTTNGRYGETSSPLLNALRNAAQGAATRFFAEQIENDAEFRASIEGLYKDAVAKFLNQESREKVVERMAERLSAAFGDRY